MQLIINCPRCDENMKTLIYNDEQITKAEEKNLDIETFEDDLVLDLDAYDCKLFFNCDNCMIKYGLDFKLDALD